MLFLRKKAGFTHIELTGSSYDAGHYQGRLLSRHIFAGRCLFSGGMPKQAYADLRNAFEDVCPGITAEIEGMADALRARPENALFLSESWLRAGAGNGRSGFCSQFSVLPSFSGTGETLCGRSYEFSPRWEDLRLCTTGIDLKNRHIGFSLLLLGRTEGMNENGLCVTATSAGMPVGSLKGMRRPGHTGFHFWLIVRAVLETCDTIEDALYLIKSAPLGCNFSFILSHCTGRAVLVEVFEGEKRFRECGKDGFLASTNHLTLPDMQHLDPDVMPHSSVRYDYLTSALAANRGRITPEVCRKILSGKYPDGLTCHYYKEAFGTLWSMVFNLTRLEVDICFGSPVANPWHRFTLSDTPGRNGDGIGKYRAMLPGEKADPGLFRLEKREMPVPA